MTKSLSIIGQKNTTVPDFSEVKADNVRLAGFGGLGPFAVNGKNDLIQNNTIIGAWPFSGGPGVLGAIALNNTNDQVIGNTIVVISCCQPGTYGGVWVSPRASGGIISGNHITIQPPSAGYAAQPSVGIWLTGSSSIQISSNLIESMSTGIALDAQSSRNTIQQNLVRSCNLGVKLGSGSGNLVYLNDFVRNTQNAEDDGQGNAWYSGGRGNYWDTWTSPDNNHDGIVDNPYVIPGSAGNADRSPLVSPASPYSTP